MSSNLQFKEKIEEHIQKERRLGNVVQRNKLQKILDSFEQWEDQNSSEDLPVSVIEFSKKNNIDLSKLVTNKASISPPNSKIKTALTPTDNEHRKPESAPKSDGSGKALVSGEVSEKNPESEHALTAKLIRKHSDEMGFGPNIEASPENIDPVITSPVTDLTIVHRIRDLMERKNWIEAENECDRVLNIAPEDLRTTYTELKTEIIESVNNEIELLKSQFNEKSENDLEGRSYILDQILELHKGDNWAQGQLQRLDQQRLNATTALERSQLGYRLRQRGSMEELEVGIRIAENLAANGQLDNALTKLLKDARKHFDSERQKMGQLTTQSRVGNLYEVKEALDKIRQEFAQKGGDAKVLDPTTNKWVTLKEFYEEAQENHISKSGDACQAFINIANKTLHSDPKAISEKVKLELGKPYVDNDLRILEDYQIKVNDLNQQKIEAERFIEQASDKSHSNKLVAYLKANNFYPYIENWKKEVERLRIIVARDIIERSNKQINNAKDELAWQQFSTAVETINSVNAILNEYTEPLTPDLKELKKDKNAVEKIATESLRNWNDYAKQAEKIRQDITEPQRRSIALQELEKLKSDARFTDFNDLKELSAEVAQYQGISEQFAIAEEAQKSGNWQIVYKISNDVLLAGKAAEYEKRFKEFRTKSYVFLQIDAAEEMIKASDFRDAETLIDLLKKTVSEDLPSFKSELENLVKEITATISKAKNNTTPEVDKLLDRALAEIGVQGDMMFKLSLSPRQRAKYIQDHLNNDQVPSDINKIISTFTKGSVKLSPYEIERDWDGMIVSNLSSRSVESLYEALRIFQHLGGRRKLEKFAPMEDSFHKRIGIEAADYIIEVIKNTQLSEICDLYDKRNTKTEAGPIEIQKLAEAAKKVREAKITYDAREIDACRYFEVAATVNSSIDLFKRQRWDEAFGILDELLDVYPGDPELSLNWQHARVKQTITRSNVLVAKEQATEALAMLEDLQKDNRFSNNLDVSFQIIEVYSTLHDFESAERWVGIIHKNILPELVDRDETISRLDELSDRLESNKRMLTALDLAKQEYDKGEDRVNSEIMTVLNLAISDEKILSEQVEVLTEGRATFFTEFSSQLIGKARALLNSGDDDKKILGVNNLMEVLQLEDLCEIPDNKRKAQNLINEHKKSLNNALRLLINSAVNFDPINYDLKSAIIETKRYQGKLKTFERITSIFDEDTNTTINKFDTTIEKINGYLSKLLSIETILADIKDEKIWSEAIETNQFTQLSGSVDKLMNSELSEIQDIKLVEQKLRLTKDATDKIYSMIDDIKKLLSQEEFEVVIEKVDQVRSIPTDNKEYGYVASIIGPNTVAQKVVNEKMVKFNGLDELRENTIKFTDNLALFTAWKEQIDSVASGLIQEMKKEEQIERDIAERIIFEKGENSLNQRLNRWNHIHDESIRINEIVFSKEDLESNATIDLVCIPKDKHGNEIFPLSKKASRIQSEVEHETDELLRWPERSEIKIEQLKSILCSTPFPPERDFRQAQEVGNWILLRKWVDQGNRVGPISEDQQRLLVIYENSIARHNDTPISTNWFENIMDMIRSWFGAN